MAMLLVNVNSTFFPYRSFIIELFVFIIELLNCSGSYWKTQLLKIEILTRIVNKANFYLLSFKDRN